MTDLQQALMPGGPLAGLAVYPQFILWMTADRGGKVTKLPVNPNTGQVCNAHDEAAWVDAFTGLQWVNYYGGQYGLGFVFTEDDPFFFLDIDNCLQEDNTWSPIAQQMLQVFQGCAVEVSISGRGLHVFGRGALGSHGSKNISYGLELYSSARFVALTGSQAKGSTTTSLDISVPTWLVDSYFPPNSNSPSGAANLSDWGSGPVPEWAGPTDDEELLKKALSSSSSNSVFMGKASFSDLWVANAEALSINYPDASGARPYDESSADAALAQHLAFWTGKDPDRMLRLMRMSKLVRSKWDREDYLQRTINFAVSHQETVYTRGQQQPLAPAQVHVDGPPTGEADLTIRPGYQFVPLDKMIEWFKGCVYVRHQHRVFIPDGDLLKPEQFRDWFAGYVFPLDSNNRKTTTDAWKAFVNSQAVFFPKATRTCFRPQRPTGELVSEESQVLVNTYVPIDTPRADGDHTPFTNHLKIMLPDKNDQDILLAYMAACIQHKGVKFQWAPLLQGCEGNGKTLFTRCVAFAIGKRYVHYPKASDLDNKFNDWLANKLFIGVEDIYVPDNRRGILETLKPMITAGDGIEIQKKGVDQVTMDICANFMLNSNHDDAIKKTRNDRRFAVMFTAQQDNADMIRDGMLEPDGVTPTGYFVELYNWLRDEGGYAIVAKYLEEYQIPAALNPAGLCHRAPRTSTYEEVISANEGTIEQEVRLAIEEGLPGFANGWISSKALTRLLDEKKLLRLLPPNKRSKMLATLGYIPHPRLPGGRVNRIIPLDGGKPKLFIKMGMGLESLGSVEVVTVAYVAAQGVGAAVTPGEKEKPSSPLMPAMQPSLRD